MCGDGKESYRVVRRRQTSYTCYGIGYRNDDDMCFACPDVYLCRNEKNISV